MAVKILIRRKAPSGNAEALTSLMKRLRALALQQPAYISGETLERLDKPGEYLIISTWRSLEAWNQWLANEERCLIQEQVDALLEEKTAYAVYGYS